MRVNSNPLGQTTDLAQDAFRSARGVEDGNLESLPGTADPVCAAHLDNLVITLYIGVDAGAQSRANTLKLTARNLGWEGWKANPEALE